MEATRLLIIYSSNADDSSANIQLVHTDNRRQPREELWIPAMICSHVEKRVRDLWMEPTAHADT